MFRGQNFFFHTDTGRKFEQELRYQYRYDTDSVLQCLSHKKRRDALNRPARFIQFCDGKFGNTGTCSVNEVIGKM
jgi:hypothetical protein